MEREQEKAMFAKMKDGGVTTKPMIGFNKNQEV